MQVTLKILGILGDKITPLTAQGFKTFWASSQGIRASLLLDTRAKKLAASADSALTVCNRRLK